MNELFLSGTILTLLKIPTTGDTSHVVCQLRHSHRNRQQQVIFRAERKRILSKADNFLTEMATCLRI